MRPALEDDFVVDDHEANDSISRLGELRQPIAKPVVRHDGRIELARERKNEVVGVGSRGDLTNRAGVDHPLVLRGIVDLMTQGGVGHDNRLEPFLFQLVAHGDDIGDERLFTFRRVGDVRSVDDDDVAFRLIGRQ